MLVGNANSIIPIKTTTAEMREMEFSSRGFRTTKPITPHTNHNQYKKQDGLRFAFSNATPLARNDGYFCKYSLKIRHCLFSI